MSIIGFKCDSKLNLARHSAPNQAQIKFLDFIIWNSFKVDGCNISSCNMSKNCLPYSREQKHVLLFQKSNI